MSETCPEQIEINGTKYTRNDSLAAAKCTTRGPLTLVRTYAAGVYVGYCKREAGSPEVTIYDARLLHSWKGAKTTLEIAHLGVASGSNLSEKVPEVSVLGVVATIPVSSKAATSLGY